MIAIYARHHSIEQNNDQESLEEAIQRLRRLCDKDHGYALGIYDPTTKTMYIEHSSDVATCDPEWDLKQRLADFQELDLQIDNIEYYKP